MAKIYWFNPYALSNELDQDRRQFKQAFPQHKLEAFNDLTTAMDGLIIRGPFDAIMTALVPDYRVPGMNILRLADQARHTAPRYALIPYGKQQADKVLKDIWEVKPTFIETPDLFHANRPTGNVFVNTVRETIASSLK